MTWSASALPPPAHDPWPRDRSPLPIPTARCRKCGGDSKVIRTMETDGPILRRRECAACGHRWTTREIPD
jgi:hypothetical protein